MRNRDDYRSLDNSAILLLAREEGVDPEMGIVLAERLEKEISFKYAYGEASGGRYTFNNRSA